VKWRYYANNLQFTRGGAWAGFELFRVMQLVPQGFHDQTDQRIRNGIRR